jgi:hypothetical protein
MCRPRGGHPARSQGAQCPGGLNNRNEPFPSSIQSERSVFGIRTRGCSNFDASCRVSRADRVGRATGETSPSLSGPRLKALNLINFNLGLKRSYSPIFLRRRKVKFCRTTRHQLSDLAEWRGTTRWIRFWAHHHHHLFDFVRWILSR